MTLEIIVAKRYAGFCSGVRRAWDLATQTADIADEPIYLSGKLIHNGPAMQELEQLGIHVVPSSQSPDGPGTLIIRAHGEAPEVYSRAETHGLRIVDATCRIVKAVQRKARDLEAAGYQVVVVGHRYHPEAIATAAHTERGIIVETPQEVEALGTFDRIAAIAQTTVLQSDFDAVCAALKSKCRVLENHGRICSFTMKAQEEALQIARQVDAMVVVGGRDSSNTRRLVEVCSAICPTYLVESVDELAEESFAGATRVGVTAGASTRAVDLEKVVLRLQSMSIR